MQLTETHFDAVAGHLVSTLHQLNVPQEIIEEVVSIVLSTKNDVLNV
jgi:hemoglobin